MLEQHAAAVSRYCLRRLPVSDVNDVVAEVFAVAWRKLDTMPEGDAELPWLYAVARNEVLKARRSTSRRNGLMERVGAQPQYPDPGPEPVVVRRAEAKALMSAVASLRPADQEVLVLRTHEDLTLSEIAAVLGCSVEAAKKRLSRALSRLRRAAGIPESANLTSGSRANQEGGGDQ